MDARTIVLSCMTVWVCTFLPHAAYSQAYPTKPIRLIVPFPPGGVDVSIRMMQNAFAEDLGQPVIIENRPGANGAIGAEMVARSAPDGYTLMATSIATFTGAAISKVPYDPVKDFAPITMIYTSMGVVAARPSLEVNSIAELIDYARRNPGKLSYASTGVGSEQHLSGEDLKLTARIDINHIPYKGFGPVVQAMMAQEVDIAFFTYQAARPLLRAGKAKPIAVYFLRKRHPDLPNVADITETVPEFQTTRSWSGLFAPAGLPRPLLTRLNASAVKSINTPSVRSQLESAGYIVMANTPEDFAQWIKTDFDTAVRLTQALKAAGVTFE